MKFQNGLKIYGIYIFDKYPEWKVLLTNLDESMNGVEYLEGLAFDVNTGEFSIGVSLTLPIEYKEVGYLLNYKHTLNLSLR